MALLQHRHDFVGFLDKVVLLRAHGAIFQDDGGHYCCRGDQLRGPDATQDFHSKQKGVLGFVLATSLAKLPQVDFRQKLDEDLPEILPCSYLGESFTSAAVPI